GGRRMTSQFAHPSQLARPEFLVATQSTSAVVRSILSADLNLPADEVIKRAKARGLKASEATIRHLVYNVRSELKKAAPKSAAPSKPAQAAARQTPAPPAPAKSPAARPAPKPAVSSAPSELTKVFANVALVNKVVGVAGGVDQARKVAEAVRACGGVDAFLKHLDLVAGIRTSEA